MSDPPSGGRSHPSGEREAKELQDTLEEPDKFLLLSVAVCMDQKKECSSPSAPGWGAMPTENQLSTFMVELSGTLGDSAPGGLPPSPAHPCRSLLSPFS